MLSHNMKTHRNRCSTQNDTIHIHPLYYIIVYFILPVPSTNTSRGAMRPQTQEMVPFSPGWRQVEHPSPHSSRKAHQPRPRLYSQPKTANRQQGFGKTPCLSYLSYVVFI